MPGVRLIEYILLGLGNLLRYKLRSLLTVLGIVFGISALLCMMAVGTGAREQLLRDMEKMGLRNIIVRSKKPEAEAMQSKSQSAAQQNRMLEYGLTFKDFERCKATLPGLVRALPIHELYQAVMLDGRRVNARVMGVTTDYFKSFQTKVMEGRALTGADAAQLRQVCLLGHPLPKEVARGRDAMNSNISVGGNRFDVVGLISPIAKTMDRKEGAGNAAAVLDIYVPYETAVRRFGTRSFKNEQGRHEAFKLELDQIILEMENEGQVLAAVSPLKAILKKDRTKEDYEITVPLELLRQQQRAKDVFNLVLILISVLTLLVGGIGIVNIMLVSVAERTKEIGIRRALGARRRDIMLQFIIETVALTLAGGILGCLAGAGGVAGIAHYTGWPVIITPLAVGVSILVSAGTGILFGLYPARRAAHINPVVALRYE